jgi:hypothetical protein
LRLVREGQLSATDIAALKVMRHIRIGIQAHRSHAQSPIQSF